MDCANKLNCAKRKLSRRDPKPCRNTAGQKCDNTGYAVFPLTTYRFVAIMMAILRQRETARQDGERKYDVSNSGDGVEFLRIEACLNRAT